MFAGGAQMTLQKFLGIELPVIQAPMAGVQGSALAVAVSNAGGMGSLPCAMLGPDAMRKELPVIAAGGIADAQGVAAALALGAAGVQIGTAYMLCPEASTGPVHRAALK